MSRASTTDQQTTGRTSNAPTTPPRDQRAESARTAPGHGNRPRQHADTSSDRTQQRRLDTPGPSTPTRRHPPVPTAAAQRKTATRSLETTPSTSTPTGPERSSTANDSDPNDTTRTTPPERHHADDTTPTTPRRRHHADDTTPTTPRRRHEQRPHTASSTRHARRVDTSSSRVAGPVRSSTANDSDPNAGRKCSTVQADGRVDNTVRVHRCRPADGRDQIVELDARQVRNAVSPTIDDVEPGLREPRGHRSPVELVAIELVFETL